LPARRTLLDEGDRALDGVRLLEEVEVERGLLALDVLDRAWPPDVPAPTTIVVLPESVARHWWDRVLYNQTARRLKAALVGREHTVIADVPYRRSDHPAAQTDNP
jgi:hypothetical protein